MRSAIWIKKISSSRRNAKYCGPGSMSYCSPRMRSSAFCATRQMMNAITLATCCMLFGVPFLCQRLLMRTGRLFLANVEMILAARALVHGGELERFGLDPGLDVGGSAGAGADQFQHLAGLHRIEQLFRLDDRAGG